MKAAVLEKLRVYNKRVNAQVPRFLLLCAAIVTLAACSANGAAKGDGPPTPLIKAEPARTMRFVDIIEAVGTALANEQVTIAVLVNTVGPVSPDAITGSIAALLFGRPQPAAPVALDHPAVDYVGVFRGIGRGDSLTITVSADSGAVRLRIGGQGQGPVARYVGNDTFMIGRNRYAFQREGGRVTGLRADMISVVSRLTHRPG